MKMIDVVTDFKHGASQFYKGERRLVPDEEAEYFLKNRWAVLAGDSPVVPQPSDVQLEVHSPVHKSQSRT